PVAPAEEIAVADRIVAGIEGLALPPELEQAGGHPALVAGIEVDGPPALGRPADDFDGEALRLLHQAAIALQALLRRRDQRCLMPPPDPRGRHIGDVLGDLGDVQIHGGSPPLSPALKILAMKLGGSGTQITDSNALLPTIRSRHSYAGSIEQDRAGWD